MRRFVNHRRLTPQLAIVNPLVSFGLQNHAYFNMQAQINQRKLERKNIRNAFLFFVTYGVATCVFAKYSHDRQEIEQEIEKVNRLKKYDEMTLDEMTNYIQKEFGLYNNSSKTIFSLAKTFRDWAYHPQDTDYTLDNKIDDLIHHEVYPFFVRKNEEQKRQKDLEINTEMRLQRYPEKTLESKIHEEYKQQSIEELAKILRGYVGQNWSYEKIYNAREFWLLHVDFQNLDGSEMIKADIASQVFCEKYIAQMEERSSNSMRL